MNTGCLKQFTSKLCIAIGSMILVVGCDGERIGKELEKSYCSSRPGKVEMLRVEDHTGDEVGLELNELHDAGQRELTVFFDGTGNTEETDTNIWTMYRYSVLDACDESHPVIPIYMQGVGTTTGNKILGGATGAGIGDRIQEGYEFLSNVYRKGDEIYIFGFSRGALAARSLSGMIEFVGLLERDGRDKVDPKDVRTLYDFYHVSYDGKPEWEKRHKRNIKKAVDIHKKNFSVDRDVKVSGIGVFDTVAALGIGSDDNPDSHRTNLYADRGYHALSLDEQRKNFRPLRFDDRVGSRLLEEVWFSGGHADVGGGYGDTTGLERLSRVWMLGKFADTGVFKTEKKLLGSGGCPSFKCELAELHDEFFTTFYKDLGYKDLGSHIRKPRRGDKLHESVLCRRYGKLEAHKETPDDGFNPEFYNLRAPNEERESKEGYKPENLYSNPTDAYEIVGYNCLAKHNGAMTPRN
jgi:hypothetical protein